MEYSYRATVDFMNKNGLEMDDINKLHVGGNLPDGYTKNKSTGVVRNAEGTEVGGITKYSGRKYVFFGSLKYDVHLFPRSYRNPEQLYLTIGHELVHAHLYSMGLYDHDRHENTAYNWNFNQANTWGLYNLADYYLGIIMKNYLVESYPYQRSIRLNRPVK